MNDDQIACRILKTLNSDEITELKTIVARGGIVIVRTRLVDKNLVSLDRNTDKFKITRLGEQVLEIRMGEQHKK